MVCQKKPAPPSSCLVPGPIVVEGEGRLELSGFSQPSCNNSVSRKLEPQQKVAHVRLETEELRWIE